MAGTACSRPPVHIEEQYNFNDSVDEYAKALLALDLDATAMGRQWLDWADPSDRLPGLDLLPVAELRLFDKTVPEAAYYLFEAVRGQRVTIELEADGSFGYFADLFGTDSKFDPRRSDSSPGYTPAASAWFGEAGSGARLGSSRIVFEPRQTRFFLLRIIPRLLEGGSLNLSISSGPIAALWPVDGTGPAQVWSFFGDPRDGGSRVHHGIDIFAPRGTPIRSPVAGRISRVGERPLGGQTVTLIGRDNGLVYYFAHLDEYGDVMVGQEVEAGHLLGTVGNTGNARTTPPHLHLGIYDQTWRTPVDPWYFLVGAPNGTPAGNSAALSFKEPGFPVGLEPTQLASLTGRPADSVLYNQVAATNRLPVSPARRDGSGTALTANDRPVVGQGWGQAIVPANAEPISEARPVALRTTAIGYRLADGSLGWLPVDAGNRLANLPATQAIQRP